MKDAPVSLALDLWSLGHSGADIVAKLGFPNRRAVERIVEQARLRNDERAVYHVTSNGRILGTGIPKRKRYRVRRQTHYKGFMLIDLLGKPLCPRGHMRLPHSINKSGSCRQCERARPR